MIKKALIIVPHPDDELNIAYGLFDALKEHQIETTVVICTNGDYVKQNTHFRYKETKRVQKIYDYNRLIYLGYGDGYLNTHIYDATNETVVSNAGYNETYCPSGDEYCYSKYGIHHAYTKENMLKDLMDLILDIKADLIICNDIDNHPDHKCVSLIFDEAIKKIIISQISYNPIILKGFAYEGAWNGPRDFFYPTINGASIDPNTQASFPYDWNDRIRFEVPKSNLSLFFWKSKLFKALVCYMTQNASNCPINRPVYCFSGISNPDCIYWYRSTSSLSYKAKIEVSSGNASYINDFKLYDTVAINNRNTWIGAQFWVPDYDDTYPSVSFIFDRPAIVKQVVIYQNAIRGVESLKIENEYGDFQVVDCPFSNRLCIPITGFNASNTLKIHILKKKSDIVQIGEIEIYDQNCSLDYNTLPFVKYNDAVKYKKRGLISRFIMRNIYNTIESLLHRIAVIRYKS